MESTSDRRLFNIYTALPHRVLICAGDLLRTLEKLLSHAHGYFEGLFLLSITFLDHTQILHSVDMS